MYMNTLTLADVAVRLKEPPTSVRYWAKQFSAYLKPYMPEKGRFPLYGEDDYTILQAVRKHYKDGKTASVIRQLLVKEFGEVIEQRTGDDEETTNNRQQPEYQGASSLTTISQLNNNFKEWLENQSLLADSYKRQNVELAERLAELEKEVVKKTETIRELREQLANQVIEPPTKQSKPPKPTRAVKKVITGKKQAIPQPKPKQSLWSRLVG